MCVLFVFHCLFYLVRLISVVRRHQIEFMPSIQSMLWYSLVFFIPLVECNGRNFFNAKKATLRKLEFENRFEKLHISYQFVLSHFPIFSIFFYFFLFLSLSHSLIRIFGIFLPFVFQKIRLWQQHKFSARVKRCKYFGSYLRIWKWQEPFNLFWFDIDRIA